MRKLVLIAVAGAGVLWTALALYGSDVHRAGASRPAITGDGESAEREDEIARLRVSLKRTEQRLAQLEVSGTPQAAASEDALHDSNADPRPEAQALPLELSDTDRRSHIAKTFASQPADPSWNPHAAIGALFRALLPAGSALVQVECHQTLCRVETAHSDTEAQRAYVNALAMSPDQGRPFQGMLFDEGEPSRVGRGIRSVTFLLRPGHDFPSPE